MEHDYRRFKIHGSARRRGAATVEAVIVLPIFTVILIGLFYVRDQIVEQQQAEAKAKSCAWLYSAAACEEIPPGCGDIFENHQVGGHATDELYDAITGSGNGGGKVGEIVKSTLEPLLEAAFGSSGEAKVETSVEAPRLYGGGRRNVQGRYQLACNLNPTTPQEVLERAWKEIVP